MVIQKAVQFFEIANGENIGWRCHRFFRNKVDVLEKLAVRKDDFPFQEKKTRFPRSGHSGGSVIFPFRSTTRLLFFSGCCKSG